MAVLVANPDGTSNAQAGDYVVTGGGIFRKNEDGSSTKIESLSSYIGTEKTKDYSKLSTIANSFVAKNGVTGGINTDTKIESQAATAPAQSEKYIAQSVDDNGILSGVVFTPIDYSDTSDTGSSAGASKILGYVVVGLVSIALLDRFMNGSSKK